MARQVLLDLPEQQVLLVPEQQEQPALLERPEQLVPEAALRVLRDRLVQQVEVNLHIKIAAELQSRLLLLGFYLY